MTPKEADGEPIVEQILMAYSLAMLHVYSYDRSFMDFINNFSGVDSSNRARGPTLLEVCTAINDSLGPNRVDATKIMQQLFLSTGRRVWNFYRLKQRTF